MKLDKKIMEELSPGIKDFVVWLNDNGFDTIDSGDGSNHEDGMECAVEFPMVAIQVMDKNKLISEADRLIELIDKLDKPDTNRVVIEASYLQGNMCMIVVLDPEDTGALDWR